MLYLDDNNSPQVATWIMTLTESIEMSPASYDFLCEAVHDITGDVKYFILTDTSLYTDRYNKFIVDNGIIGMFVGDHKYTVYQNTQASPPSMTPDANAPILERGYIRIIGSDETPGQYDITFTKDVPSWNG